MGINKNNIICFKWLLISRKHCLRIQLDSWHCTPKYINNKPTAWSTTLRDMCSESQPESIEDSGNIEPIRYRKNRVIMPMKP